MCLIRVLGHMLSFTRQSYYFFLFHRLSPYIFFKKAPYIISFHYLYLTNLLFKTQIKRPKQIHPTKKNENKNHNHTVAAMLFLHNGARSHTA